MKIEMYMYDRPLELDEESTVEFLKQYDNARDTMRNILTMYEDEDTRLAMFYCMGLRSLLDDFLEFCTQDLSADLMEALLNDEDAYVTDYDLDDDNEIEIEVDVDDEE